MCGSDVPAQSETYEGAGVQEVRDVEDHIPGQLPELDLARTRRGRTRVLRNLLHAIM